MKLETRGITKSFDGTRIIEDISITLGEGELVCLLGVSGGGQNHSVQHHWPACPNRTAVRC